MAKDAQSWSSIDADGAEYGIKDAQLWPILQRMVRNGDLWPNIASTTPDTRLSIGAQDGHLWHQMSDSDGPSPEPTHKFNSSHSPNLS